MDLRDSPADLLKDVQEIVNRNEDLYAKAEREKYSIDEAAYKSWRITIDKGVEKGGGFETRKTITTRAQSKKVAEKQALQMFAKKYNAGSTNKLKVTNAEEGS